MILDAIRTRGLVLLGCGKMGSALLDGWLKQGLAARTFTILDPQPSEWLQDLAGQGLRLNADLPENPAAAIFAVKPQMMDAALPTLAPLSESGTVLLSIAAGMPITRFEAAFGSGSPIVRAMPNTPASIGLGVTALVGNAAAQGAPLELAEALMAAVGETVRLAREDQMDAVTAVSGSGPAYVFLMVEALAAAGEAEGLEPELAMKLARATVSGAGAMVLASAEPPSHLRRNVTSPGGTTAAALAVLMREEAGLLELMAEAVRQAARRSRELAG
jgi:pyrroline-5-carboxylate reductase